MGIVYFLLTAKDKTESSPVVMHPFCKKRKKVLGNGNNHMFTTHSVYAILTEEA